MDHIYVSPAVHKVTIDGVDHFTGTRTFIHPPKKPDDDIIELFSEDINEFVPQKLQEIIARQDELILARTEALNSLHKKDLDEFSTYFNASLIELEFVEYDLLTKWIKYWLRLYKKASTNKEWELLTEVALKQGFTEEQLDTAREHPIEDLYEGRLRKVGGRFTGLCPFHNEKTPSFHIFEENNHFHCFGCQAHGNAIDFYMKLNDCDFITAVKSLI